MRRRDAALSQGIKDISVQSSASLQHLPYNKDLETELPKDLVSRLSFAKQKLGEIVNAAKSAKSSGGKLTDALPTVSESPLPPQWPHLSGALSSECMSQCSVRLRHQVLAGVWLHPR